MADRITDYHRERAEDLISTARSTSMAGWFRRRRRTELLAAALVHAILARKDRP